MKHSESLSSFRQARQLIPGGVNSPVRAFRAVSGSPIFFEKGSGAYIHDIDGNAYIDYVGSWGPMLQGHSYPPVVDAIQDQAATGIGFGAPSLAETELAALVAERIPSVEKVRFVNSGTEATMSAVRLARGFTGRDHILKFEGCFHGHSDALLVKAGSGVLTLGLPDSPGVPSSVAEMTHTVPFNDLAALEVVLDRFGEEIACAIVEPIAGNMGCICPNQGFLEGVRDLTEANDTLLILDEVMTGFRVHSGGAQCLYDVQPDLSTFGKIIGGGLPVGAYGGRSDIMDYLAPDGPVYQSGTLSGNPLAMRAGIALLDSLNPGFYRELARQTHTLAMGMRESAKRHSIPLVVNDICGMFGLFFTHSTSVERYSDVLLCDTRRYAQFFHSMLEHGVYFAPSAFESAFVSGSHGHAEIAETLRVAELAFAGLT